MQLEATEQRASNWLELAENTFKFCRYARYWFTNGTWEDKKIILSTIGLNLSLKDKILTIEPVKLFSLMKEPQKVSNWGG